MYAFVILLIFGSLGGQAVDGSYRTLFLGLAASLAFLDFRAGISDHPDGRKMILLGAAWTGLGLCQLLPIWENVVPLSSLQVGASKITRMTGVERAAVLTIERDATLAWLLASLFPIAALLSGLKLDNVRKNRLILAIAWLAFPSILVAAFQISIWGNEFNFYGVARASEGVGQFVNRNHLSTLLAVSLSAAICSAHVRMKQSFPRTAVISSIFLLFVLVSVGLGSRMGIVLNVVAGAFTAGALSDHFKLRKWSSRIVWLVVPVLALTIAIGLSSVGRVNLARFGAYESDARWQIWKNTLPIVVDNWPAGTGMGTFVRAYAASQPLTDVGPYYINRAHNDILEVAVEGGAFGLALLMLFSLQVILMLRRSNWASRQRAGLVFGATTVLIYLLHSFIDYPLRYPLHMVLLGFALSMIASRDDCRKVKA